MIINFDFIKQELRSLLNDIYQTPSVNRQADIVRSIMHLNGYCHCFELRISSLEKKIESLENQSHYVDRYVSTETGEILN